MIAMVANHQHQPNERDGPAESPKTPKAEMDPPTDGAVRTLAGRFLKLTPCWTHRADTCAIVVQASRSRIKQTKPAPIKPVATKPAPPAAPPALFNLRPQPAEGLGDAQKWLAEYHQKTTKWVEDLQVRLLRNQRRPPKPSPAAHGLLHGQSATRPACYTASWTGWASLTRPDQRSPFCRKSTAGASAFRPSPRR